MPVDSWDPAASGLQSRHREILNAACASLEDDSIAISSEDQAFLRPTMQRDAAEWQRFVAGEKSTTVVAWVKVLTLVERDFNGFEAGSRSPVLTLTKILKSRGELPPDLFAWIKAHTDNRFLPYGSLSDRL